MGALAGLHNLQTGGQSSRSSSFRWDPLMDLLAGGGVRHVLLGAAAHVDLVDISQELLGLRWVCGGGVVCHTVQPAMPFSWNHAAIHLPHGVLSIHFCCVDYPAVTPKKIVLAVLIVLVSIFIHANQGSCLHIIRPANEKPKSDGLPKGFILHSSGDNITKTVTHVVFSFLAKNYAVMFFSVQFLFLLLFFVLIIHALKLSTLNYINARGILVAAKPVDKT